MERVFKSGTGDALEEADNPRVHDALVKEQEQEPEVAADRYRQQNVCHADCVIHILPFLVRILNYNFGHKGSLSHPRTG